MFGGEIQYVSARPGEARNTLADNSLLREKTGWRTENDLESYIENFLTNVK